MSLNLESELRNITGITDEEKQRIYDFLQGAVYCWCKNRKDEWFSLREFMGGPNYFWQGTPMLPLYLKHEGDSADPVKEAGKDGGWLLKHVIMNDKRLFETKREALIRQYRWIGGDEEGT